MDEHVSKGLNVGAGLILALVIIATVISIVLVGISLATKASSKAEDKINNFTDTEYTIYDNTTVSGDTILTLIKTNESQEISIVVDNGNGAVNFIYESSGASSAGSATLGDALDHDAESTALRNANDKTNSAYISPTKKFICTVCRDETTEAITALYFEPVTE